jgi:hypothetical protein
MFNQNYLHFTRRANDLTANDAARAETGPLPII